MRPATRLVCPGCGWEAPRDEPFPFRCPRVGTDGVDHVPRRILDPAGIDEPVTLFSDPEPNPFLRYRRLLHSWQVGRSRGLSDDGFRHLVQRLDGAVAAVEGRRHGFRETPLARQPELARGLGLGRGELWVKDETGNVAGSHKARHLMGLALWLEMARRTGWIPSLAEAPPLAIASCGNAALAAAVVAAGAGRSLKVFVPPWAEPAVVERIAALGAELVVCPRREGESGDPCYRRFLEAVGRGALPFTGQGSSNALTLEGGRTLAWEMVSTLAGEQAGLDRLFVQVGGGALASSLLQGLGESVELGLLPRLPRVHTVQTRGAWPLWRAWDRLAARGLGEAPATEPHSPRDAERARRLHGLTAAEHDGLLRWAATHREELMWPWEQEPCSIATGILDDETYDWHAVVAGMLRTGGWPVVVDETTLEEANALGQGATGIDVDPTGTAGLAGLLEVARRGELDAEERVGVLFTGVRR